MYNITPSDYSVEFIKRFNQKYDDKVLKVSAVDVNVYDNYDCIYFSKVLNSISEDEIIKSLKKQYKVLNNEGYIFHTLWYGDRNEDNSYIDEYTLQKILKLDFEYVEFKYYKEADFNDSQYDSVIIIVRNFNK